MAAADILQIPSGWVQIYSSMPNGPIPAQINGAPAGSQIFQCDQVDTRTVQLGPLVLGKVPNIQAQLASSARQYGSTLYGLALLQTTEFNLFGLAKVQRYRWIVVHRFFPALAILIGLFAGALVLLAVLNQQTALEQLNNFSKQLCNMFGPGCIVQNVTNTWLAVALIGGAATLAGIWLVGHEGGKGGKVKPAELQAPGPPSLPRPPKTTIQASLPGPKGSIGATLGG